jgi:hypothetical protein
LRSSSFLTSLPTPRARFIIQEDKKQLVPECHRMPFRICLFFSGAPLVLLLTFSAVLDASSQDKSGSRTPALPEPKLFTLQSPKVMLRQALADLAKQTGIVVETVPGLPEQPFHLNLQRVPFWKALDSIAAASNARVNLYPHSGRIVLDNRGPLYRLPPISYDGRFRLAIKRVTGTRDLEVRANDPAHGAYTLAIEVAWDPELQPLYLETRPHGVRLMDNKKNILAIPEDGSSLAPVDGRIALLLDLRIPPLPRSVATLRSLEGELSMIGPSKMLSFTFDTLDKLAKLNADDPERRLTQEDVTCQIRKVTLDPRRWSIQVAIDYPPSMKQLDSNQSWVVNNEMVLESTDGKKRFASREYVLESSTPRRAVLSYHFRDKESMPRGKPSEWKVNYRTPANLIEMPIKFSFKDIELP